MEYAQKTIETLEQKLRELVAQETKIKITINCLCDVLGEPMRYPDAGESGSKVIPPRRDQYYGRPVATVVTEALEKRKAAGLGAATEDELFTELAAGGFVFIGKNDGIQKRGLAITLAKNPKFTKVGGNSWGLTAWYPEAAKLRAKRNNDKAESEESEDAEEAGQEVLNTDDVAGDLLTEDENAKKEKRATDAA